MSKRHLIKGIGYWAQILGDPRPGYGGQHLEWSLDLSLDEDTITSLKQLGLGPKIRNKGDDRGSFITFRRRSAKRDGSSNPPIRVVDAHGNPWTGGLIGNGSVLNVSFNLNQRPGFQGKAPTMAADILSVQVWDHVPYSGKDEFPVKEAAEGEASSEERDW